MPNDTEHYPLKSKVNTTMQKLKNNPVLKSLKSTLKKTQTVSFYFIVLLCFFSIIFKQISSLYFGGLLIAHSIFSIIIELKFKESFGPGGVIVYGKTALFWAILKFVIFTGLGIFVIWLVVK